MFVVLEGIDGSGKTYLANKITEYLNSIKEDSAICTSEPYRSIDSINPFGNKTYDEDLFYKDRIIHFSEVIAPAMIKFKHVICDRFQLSTVAYQDGSELLFYNVWCKYGLYAVNVETFYSVHHHPLVKYEPDILILLRRDYYACLKEIEKRGEDVSKAAIGLANKSYAYKRALYEYEHATRCQLGGSPTFIVSETADKAFEEFKKLYEEN